MFFFSLDYNLVSTIVSLLSFLRFSRKFEVIFQHAWKCAAISGNALPNLCIFSTNLASLGGHIAVFCVANFLFKILCHGLHFFGDSDLVYLAVECDVLPPSC